MAQWIRGKALETVLAFKAVRPGDEVMAVKPEHGDSAMSTWVRPRKTTVLGYDSEGRLAVRCVCDTCRTDPAWRNTTDPNEGVDARIKAWRRVVDK